MLDPLLVLATAAAHTTRIKLGTSVLVAPFYAPLMLARSAASLDRLSGGRFVLGLGVGWSADEYAAVGVPQRGLGTRSRRGARRARRRLEPGSRGHLDEP